MNFSELIDTYLDQEFPQAQSSIFRDLSLNFKKIMEEGQLPLNERWMTLLGVATTLKDEPMAKLSIQALKSLDVPLELIQEAAEVAGIMGMNNTYYKFRSFLTDEAKEFYTRAGLRMQSLMKPATGKHLFEMMSLAVSAVNGCPACVASHEKALRDLSIETEKIHDLARIAAVAKGLSSLKTARVYLKMAE